MSNVSNIFRRHGYLVFLLVLTATICFTNYTPGTWLFGWDNLLTELNFPLNISRAFYSVWQEYQGLGLLAGMAHAADLPRQLFLLAVSIIIPTVFLRYFFHFLMLFIGVLGMYKLIKDVFLSEVDDTLSKKGALLGATFYLLNLGTVQYFFIPFEPYSTFWGLLPWELYTLLRYIHKPSRQNFLWFVLVNILAIPQAVVQTIFLVYLICVLIALATSVAQNKSGAFLRLAGKALLTILCLNAFWLLPNLYFTFRDAHVTQTAMNNKMNIDRFFHMNKARGTPADFALLRGFPYDLFEAKKNSVTYDYMMKVWRDHYKSPFVQVIGYSAFVVMLFGLAKSGKFRPFLLSLFFLCSLALLSDTVLIASVNDLLRSFPLAHQIFRNPFTKFITPAILVFSLGFGIGTSTIIRFLDRKDKALSAKVFGSLVVLFLIWQNFPAFRGEFISRQLRSAVPKEYFDLFSYLATQEKHARIMNLPQGSYWGWGSYRWGVDSSGFLWYGVEQPIMDRAFDVWSRQLEGYYWELWYAVKKKDLELFNKVLEKYQIAFILYDTTYAPSDANPFKSLYEQRNMLLANSKVTLVKQFGPLFVYKTKLDEPFTENILVKDSLPTVFRQESFSNKDIPFSKLGFYTSPPKEGQHDYLFPFESLFTNRFPEEHAFTIKENKDRFFLSTSIPKGNYVLSQPSLQTTEPIIPVTLAARVEDSTLFLRITPFQPTVTVGGVELATTTYDTEETVPIGDNNNFIISVNAQDFFTVQKLTQEFKVVGNTYLLKAQDMNAIRVYAMNSAIANTLSAEDFSHIRECTEQSDVTGMSIYQQNGTLFLKSRNASACLPYRHVLFPQDGTLYKVQFTYQSKTDEYPFYCLANENTDGCVNLKKKNQQGGFSTREAVFTDFVEVDSSQRPLLLQLILDATSEPDRNLEKQIAYKDIVLTSYSLLASVIPQINLTPSVNTTFTLGLPDDDLMTVELPKTENAFTSTSLIDKRMFKKTPLTPRNLPLSGDYALQEIEEEKAVRIYAKKNYAEFFLQLPLSRAEYGYVMRTETRNVMGFPLTLNVFTPTDYNKYVYTLLPKEKTFIQHYFVLPPFYEFDRGIHIFLVGSSFNNTPSVNDVRDISLYPLPYEFLTSISMERVNTQLVKKTISLHADVVKHNPAMYEVKIPSSEGKTLILSQSFHRGWHAYIVENGKWKIENWLHMAFPFLFGKELKEHVMVNNWANGWNLSSTFYPQSSTIVIVYLPQYLQYLGFLILPLPLLLLLKRHPTW